MKLRFTKMQGCGNDYIYVSCFEQTVAHPEELAVRLSDRHKGVGADGLILICPSQTADARMRMFNLDGSEGKMCGNGVRCVAEYLYTHGLVPKTQKSVDIDTLSGTKHIVRRAPGLLTVDMGAPVLEPARIPVAGYEKPLVNQLIEVNGEGVRVTCLSMGNPHCVIFVPRTEGLDLPREGGRFAHHKMFPEGVNTEFVQVVDETHLNMRVWERGSGETLACGTGACASVAAACLCGLCERNTDVEVRLLGGVLTLCWTDKTVQMTGDAVTVFEGTAEV